MKLRRFENSAIALGVLFTICVAVQATSANTEFRYADSYNVVTHIVVGSNEADSGKTISKKIGAALGSIRNDFDYSSYSVEASHFHTLTNGGNISFQSMLRGLGSLKAVDNPIFSDWSYSGFHKEDGSEDSVGFKSFRFQARVPVKYKGIENKSNSTTFVKYENLKLAINNIALKIGTPKVISSLPMPENGESLFFVLEVRNAETP